MMAARRRQAEREIARYLVDTGGKFTDETEREIERRFLSNAVALVNVFSRELNSRKGELRKCPRYRFAPRMCRSRSRLSRASPPPSLTVIDVFAEAQHQARAAHKRYPFADW